GSELCIRDSFYELTKNLTDSEELRNLLVEITQEDEISDVCEAGDRYLDEIFERIQTELNKLSLIPNSEPT
ncbi:hypothetical protein V3C21_24800, partial [Salmonella enterica subsp. enterica serovar Paratyphi B]